MVDVFEPNNSLATARVIGAGSYDVVGQDVDWYRIDTTVPGPMSFTMTPKGGVDVNLELWNSAGQVIAANFNTQNVLGPETINFNGTGGTYYLKVYSAAYPAAGHTTPTYGLTVQPPVSTIPISTSEPNDTIQSARTIGAGTFEVVGTNVDWYRINTASPGAMSFTMTPLGGVDVNLELYNAAGQVIATNFQGGLSAETINHFGTGGDYFLKVYSAAFPAPGHTMPTYRLAVQPPLESWPAPANEPNDTLQTAKTLTDGTSRISGLGQDYYKIDARPGLMTFTMTPSDGLDVNMVLLNSAGQQVANSFVGAQGQAGRETISYFTNVQATYYLQIFNAINPTLPTFYDLSVATPQKSWATTLDFGPIRDASVGLFDIDNDGRDEIIVGTSKGLDAQGNEIRPAGLIALEDDGTVKWTVSFPADSKPDSKTGKTYNTTSVSTAPLFSDVNGDGSIDIVVGVGGDQRADFGAVGQPGDKGGVYAISATGQILWSHINRDSFGADGRPDGVYAAPTAFDIDSDGVREVLYTSWDHYTYVLDGRTGFEERAVNLHDTTATTPKVADLNRDGIFEMIVGADITANPQAGVPADGGILHVIQASGAQNFPGWNLSTNGSVSQDYRGFYEPQVIWSSPQTADLDGNGTLEVIHGTGNFFKDARGDYVTVRNADGSQLYRMTTNGRPAAAPLIADLNNDGRPDIIQTTLDGFVHAWNHQGQSLFTTRLNTYGVNPGTVLALNATPIAVDLDNNGTLELLIGAGSQVAVLSNTGQQINDVAKKQYIFNTYGGSIAARDIDRDQRLEIITGGANEAANQGIVFRWENTSNTTSPQFRDNGYQGFQSLTNIDAFVDRFYKTILGRDADPAGNAGWNDALFTGVRAGSDVARGFIFSNEFVSRNTSNAEFVNTLFSAFFNRQADQGGFDGWMAQLNAGTSRAAVLDGFIFSQEFNNLAATFGIRPALSLGPDTGAGNDSVQGTTESDMIRTGAGNDTVTDTGVSSTSLYGQVYRLYGATLGRVPDAGGLVGWVDALNASSITLPQAAGGFVDSAEFKATYGALGNEAFVTLLYQNVLGRAPDAGGLAAWVAQLNGGASRASVVLGFSESGEYQNRTLAPLVDYMRTIELRWTDQIEGGTGNDTMAGGRGADIYVFRAGDGSDVVQGLEPWDELQLSGFGYANAAQAMARMTQQGSNVVFTDGTSNTITFQNTTLAVMQSVRINVS